MDSRRGNAAVDRYRGIGDEIRSGRGEEHRNPGGISGTPQRPAEARASTRSRKPGDLPTCASRMSSMSVPPTGPHCEDAEKYSLMRLCARPLRREQSEFEREPRRFDGALRFLGLVLKSFLGLVLKI